MQRMTELLRLMRRYRVVFLVFVWAGTATDTLLTAQTAASDSLTPPLLDRKSVV